MKEITVGIEMWQVFKNAYEMHYIRQMLKESMEKGRQRK
jgi:hypothetical protein